MWGWVYLSCILKSPFWRPFFIYVMLFTYHKKKEKKKPLNSAPLKGLEKRPLGQSFERFKRHGPVLISPPQLPPTKLKILQWAGPIRTLEDLRPIRKILDNEDFDDVYVLYGGIGSIGPIQSQPTHQSRLLDWWPTSRMAHSTRLC